MPLLLSLNRQQTQQVLVACLFVDLLELGKDAAVSTEAMSPTVRTEPSYFGSNGASYEVERPAPPPPLCSELASPPLCWATPGAWLPDQEPVVTEAESAGTVPRGRMSWAEGNNELPWEVLYVLAGSP